MDSKKVFEKYRARLVRIGILKSLIFALIIAFFLVGITAFITWFTERSVSFILGLSIGLGIFTVAVSVPVFYFTLFYPTTKKIARLLDRFGLEERLITMYELENDSSYLAMLQREDAKKKLSEVSEKRFKLQVSLSVMVLLAFAFVFAASFTTVSALAAANIIVRGSDIGKKDETEIEPIGDYYVVNYLILSGKGRIEGEITQIVGKGENTMQVTAIPDDGYVFYMWTDATGGENLGVSVSRIEFNVQKDMNFYAVFIELSAEEGKPGEGEGEGKGEGEGDPAEGEGDPAEGNGEGEDSDKEGDNQGESDDTGDEDGEGEGESGENETDSENGQPDDGEGGGRSRENNNVIDGTQDYREDFDREKHEEELAENDTYPDDLKDILGDYYESLKP